MIAQAHSATLLGIEAVPIVVEMDLVYSPEMKFIMVGLPDKAVEESKERVQTAIRNCNLDLPKKKVICNLAPGDIRKEGPWLDLPIAVSLLGAAGSISHGQLEHTLFLGELGLDGALRPINGAVSV